MKLKFLFDKDEDILKTQFGIGAEAVGEATLPIKSEPLIEGLPMSKPEDKPEGLFEDKIMQDIHKVNFESYKLWFKELKESKDKIAFLKGEGQSPELEELRKRYNELAPYMYAKSEQWISNISMIAVGIGMAWQLTNALVTSGFKIKDKVLNAKEIEGVLRRARAAYVTETGKFKATLSDNDFTVIKQINYFLKTTKRSSAAREMLEKIVEKTGGLSFPQQVNIFGTKLYAGLPADEIVKSLVKTGKVTADIARELSLAKPELVSQVIQNLSVASPAIAAKLGPELVKLIPEEVYPYAISKETGMPMTKEELALKPSAKEAIPVSTKDFSKFGSTGQFKFTGEYSQQIHPASYHRATRNKVIVYAPIYKNEKGEILVDMSQAVKKRPDDFIDIYAQATARPTPKPEVPKVEPKITEIPKLTKDERTLLEGAVEAEEGKIGRMIPSFELFGTKTRERAITKLEEREYTNKEGFLTEKGMELANVLKGRIEAEEKYPIKIIKEEIEELQPLATPKQIKKAHAIANSKALISDKGKMKQQYREIAKIFTEQKSIKKMTKEEAEVFIDMLDRLPEPKMKDGKLIAPSIPRTMKLTTEGFFRKKYGEPTPVWLLTDQTYYAEKLGIKPLVAPFEKGKMEFDLEFRQSSNLVDRMVNKLNNIAGTSAFAKIKSKVRNVPTKAENNMAKLVNKHEATPPGLKPGEEDVFKYFRNLSKDIWRRANEVREKVDLPPIKYKQAYFRHIADAMAKEMLEGKYPFPQGLKYWSEKMVGKKIFNPMEFQRKLSDDLIDIWSKDIRAVTKAMLWNGLKEIYLAQPSKFLNEQLNAISKDLPEYRNLSPRDQAAYDQTRTIPASTKKWLVNYINQVIKGQETELDASLNRIVTNSGLKGIFNKVLSPFGRSIGRKPITNVFVLSGRAVISGVMGWVPRQILRNSFQPVQNLALYGIKATIKAFLPASVDKNLKGLLSESLFLKSYTGFEELPTNLMGKLEKVWLGPYGIVAVNNAKLGMKAAYWNIIELIRNPKFKKHGWADSSRTKDTPKGFLYPSEKEKLLREMEFGASATQYQYIPIGMPGIFRYKALVPLTRLQSWWMNYFTKFLRESTHRAFKGRPSWSGEDGPTLPWSRRVNFLKYLIIGGAILTSLGYRRSFLLGVAPTYLSPAGQVALGFYNYVTTRYDWQRQRALKQIYYSWKAFIPGSLAWRDFLAVWNGEKELKEILFYGKKEEKKIPPPLEIKIPKSEKLKFTEPKLDIKSTKLKFTF